MSSHCFTVVQCTWVQTMQVFRKLEKNTTGNACHVSFNYRPFDN